MFFLETHFILKADPPETSKIPSDDAVGVTVILITASYREQEFVRVGYYVTNEYEDPEMREMPPAAPQFDKLIRTIASNEPRVTKFKINWEPKPVEGAVTSIEGIESTSEMQQQLAPGAPIQHLPPSFDSENNKENIINQTATKFSNGEDIISESNNSNSNYLQNLNNGVLTNGDDNMIN